MTIRFALYTTLFLHFGGAWLLLQRAPTKRLMPSRYTGLGGRAEPHELENLSASVLRELKEETGLESSSLEHLSLRRILSHNRAGEPLTTLLYFTAELKSWVLPECTEGTLHWAKPGDFGRLDMIETTAHVLPELVRDVALEPRSAQTVRLGVAQYEGEALQRVVWG